MNAVSWKGQIFSRISKYRKVYVQEISRVRKHYSCKVYVKTFSWRSHTTLKCVSKQNVFLKNPYNFEVCVKNIFSNKPYHISCVYPNITFSRVSDKAPFVELPCQLLLVDRVNPTNWTGWTTWGTTNLQLVLDIFCGAIIDGSRLFSRVGLREGETQTDPWDLKIPDPTRDI